MPAVYRNGPSLVCGAAATAGDSDTALAQRAGTAFPLTRSSSQVTTSDLNPITLVIGDDHPVVLNGLTNLIGSERDIAIVATCSNGAQCLEAIRSLRPQVALLDVSMPELNGIEVLDVVRAESLPTRIMLLTALITGGDLITAEACGASGIVFKDAAPEVLLRQIRRVAVGGKWLPCASIAKAKYRQEQQQRANPSIDLVTEREREVMLYVAQGLSNREIGDQLGICEGTVKMHLHNIYQKVGVNRRSALVSLTMSLREFGVSSVG
jgi:two-component system nitrate/nitrite response regulator NarL